MKNISFGFIGGGRVVRIFLEAMQRRNLWPSHIIINDLNEQAITALQSRYPQASIRKGTLQQVAAQQWIFIAVHPPVIKDVLEGAKSFLTKDAVVISLAPKFRISALSGLLNSHSKIVRMIPNAASYLNQGYNPVCFSGDIDAAEKQVLLDFFNIFGQTIIVPEEKLEAYAMIVAMGSTYLWFQLNELQKLACAFGMDENEAKSGIKAMVAGSVATLYDAGLDYAQVVDLIPVKPIGENEEEIRNIYQTKLNGLFQKIKG